MNTFAKILVVFVLLLSCAFAVSQVLLYAKREQWRAKYEETRTQYEQKKQLAEKLQSNLEDLTAERDQLLAQLKQEQSGHKNQVAQLNSNLNRLEKANEELESRMEQRAQRVQSLERKDEKNTALIEKLRQENEKLSTRLDEQIDETRSLDKTLAKRDEKIDQLDKRIARLTEEKRQVVQARENLEAVIAELESRGIHVPPGEVPIIDAKVARVNNELGTVVLDKGESDNVKPSFPFTVYRETESRARFLARVYVTEVHTNYSVAQVDRSVSTEKPLQIGDSATTRIQ